MLCVCSFHFTYTEFNFGNVKNLTKLVATIRFYSHNRVRTVFDNYFEPFNDYFFLFSWLIFVILILN